MTLTLYSDKIMKLILTIMLSTFFLLSTQVTMAANEAEVGILTYNIHHGEGTDGVLDLARIAKVIRSTSPDIVALQEVDQDTNRTGKIDQAKELARLTNMNYVFGSSMVHDGGKYGNAILTKFDITDFKVVPLPGEPRSALVAKIAIPNIQSNSFNEITFISTHLDTELKHRLDSLPILDDLYKTIKGNDAIISGDLNAVKGSRTINHFNNNWENATRNDLFTAPAISPSKQIDFIFYKPLNKWQVLESKVLNEPVASDHLPLYVKIKLNNLLLP